MKSNLNKANMDYFLLLYKIVDDLYTRTIKYSNSGIIANGIKIFLKNTCNF